MTTLSTVSSTKPLRVCRICGLEAFTSEDLEKFTLGPTSLYGRVKLCKLCRQAKRRKHPIVPYLRKCRDCGLEAWIEEDLDKFVKSKTGKYGRINICKKCYNARCRIGGIYYEMVSKSGRKWNKKNKDKIRIREKKRKLRRIDFLGKNLTFKNSPRTNVCSQCGKKYPNELEQQTRIHHEKYDRENPLAHTVELCHSCHRKLHSAKRKRIKGKFV